MVDWEFQEWGPPEEWVWRGVLAFCAIFILVGIFG